MKCLTSQEYEGLLAAAADTQRFHVTDIEGLHALAASLISRAAEMGFVVSIDQVPKLPLAMGHYEHRVEIRPARIRA